MAHSSGRTRPLTARTLVSLAVASALGASSVALAQTAPPSASSGTEQLQEVTVTGSLIPQAKDMAVPTPTLTLSAEDLQNQGFTSVADALQNATVATGSVQNGQYSGGFTQGAQVVSLFGLDPSYTKYLIDGKPMGNYPALYNGTENFNSISGIPMELVDHVDILPGGQSSLYGSDAIAGVINIVLKKKLDAPIVDLRYGWTKDGGGTDKRFALADSVSFGGLTILGGVQYERTAPIWGYQRPLTAENYAAGTSSQTADRDWMLYGLAFTNGYVFEDPANCANVASQYGGTVSEQTRPGYSGAYCGSTRAGFYTIDNGDSGIQAYMHSTFDLNDHVEFYADMLLNHDVTSWSTGPYAYNNTFDSADPAYEYYDGNVGDYMEMQHIFSPEEAGGLGNTMSEDITNAFRFSLGAQGGIGASAWTYDASFTYDEQKLQEHMQMLNTTALESYFDAMLGPNLGPDPNGFGVNSFAPNYAQFYQPITPAQYNSFSEYVTNHSYTEDSLLRAQVTNASLFHLPGGEAGIAVVGEGGREGWNYVPDPDYADGEVYAHTSVGGTGNRSRYAGTAELRLPVLPMVSLSASGRYDDYQVTGGDFDKFTYNLGLEFHPLKSLSFRARYGTAFKAPTLADEFQGQSGYYSSSGVIDYYNCTKLGFTGTSLGNCPAQYLEAQPEGLTEGNPALQPITAKVWDGGIVWKPLSKLTLSSDFMHWGIDNEVEVQSMQQLLVVESQCLLGQLSATSPTCVAALNQVQRDSLGNLVSVNTPKINVSNETVNAVLTTLTWGLSAGHAGDFTFSGTWTDMIKHTYQQYAGDPTIDLLSNPVWSQEFKSKLNGSLTWDLGKFSSTLYVDRYGRTPNYLATVYGYGTPGAGTLGQYTITNLSLRYQVTQGLQLQFTFDNLFGTMPPQDHSYPGTASQPYDELDYSVYGRQYFLEATYKFIK